jgi:hypothetical protein
MEEGEDESDVEEENAGENGEELLDGESDPEDIEDGNVVEDDMQHDEEIRTNGVLKKKKTEEIGDAEGEEEGEDDGEGADDGEGKESKKQTKKRKLSDIDVDEPALVLPLARVRKIMKRYMKKVLY